jgi:hypothetical protein
MRVSFPPRFLVAALALGGCSNGFDPITLVNAPRVLAVKAEPPEIAAGQSTTLTAIHYPASLTAFDWAYCTHFPVIGSTDLVAPDCLSTDSGDFLVPLGSGESVKLTMPNLPIMSLGLPDSTDGFYLPVRVRYKDETGATRNAVYRLRYNFAFPPFPAPTPNQNPKLAGVYVIGGDGGLPVDAGTEGTTPLDDTSMASAGPNTPISMRALFMDGSVEMYPTLQDKMLTQVPELLDVQWFAEARGKWSSTDTGTDRPDDTFTPDKDSGRTAGQRFDIYLIAHDNRGGTDWLRRSVIFQP